MQATNSTISQAAAVITRSQRSQLQRETIAALRRLVLRVNASIEALEGVRIPSDRQLTLCLIGGLDRHLEQGLVCVPTSAERESK